MGLFGGLFGKKDEASEIKKLVHKATAKFGPPENRAGALQSLVELGTPDALGALCQRFTIRVEPGITDDDEKKYCYEALVEAGEKAVAPLKAFVVKSEQPTWGLKALDKLLPAAEMVDVILAALEKEGPDWTRDPEKKITLLRHLDQLQDARIAPRLVPFFADMNEDVRFAAVSAVADQAADEAVREPLIKTLLAAQEQKSERMKKRAAESMAKLAVNVKGFTPSVEAALPPGFSVDKEGVVKAK
jgi:HEAT repeat protein